MSAERIRELELEMELRKRKAAAEGPKDPDWLAVSKKKQDAARRGDMIDGARQESEAYLNPSFKDNAKAAAVGFADTVAPFYDELAGAGAGIKAQLMGKRGFGENSAYTATRDKARQISKDANEYNEGGTWTGAALGNVAGLAGGVSNLSKLTGGALVKGGAKIGAGGGAVGGVSRGEGLEDSLIQGGIGTAIGGAVGAIPGAAPIVAKTVKGFSKGGLERLKGAVGEIFTETLENGSAPTARGAAWRAGKALIGYGGEVKPSMIEGEELIAKNLVPEITGPTRRIDGDTQPEFDPKELDIIRSQTDEINTGPGKNWVSRVEDMRSGAVAPKAANAMAAVDEAVGPISNPVTPEAPPSVAPVANVTPSTKQARLVDQKGRKGLDADPEPQDLRPPVVEAPAQAAKKPLPSYVNDEFDEAGLSIDWSDPMQRNPNAKRAWKQASDSLGPRSTKGGLQRMGEQLSSEEPQGIAAKIRAKLEAGELTRKQAEGEFQAAGREFGPEGGAKVRADFDDLDNMPPPKGETVPGISENPAPDDMAKTMAPMSPEQREMWLSQMETLGGAEYTSAVRAALAKLGG